LIQKHILLKYILNFHISILKKKFQKSRKKLRKQTLIKSIKQISNRRRLKIMFIEGIPQNIKETDAATCRSRIFNAIEPLMKQYQMKRFNITIKNQQSEANQNKMENSENKNADDLSTSEKATQYKAMSPIYTFDQLILSNDLKEELLSAVEVIKVQNKVFEEWGLKKIEPFPRTCINFYGPSGTGKTLAAHAIANYLNKQILVASYAEIESKFHGEGPKNVKAIFHAAYKNNNLLFIDEADSLLSKRLTNVTQGSEQAINSMRSQLLICLEQFKGIVIFSTNLVENYDKAFETRVKHIESGLTQRYKAMI